MRLFTRLLRLLLPFLALTSLPRRAQNPSTLIQISEQGRLQYMPKAIPCPISAPWATAMARDGHCHGADNHDY